MLCPNHCFRTSPTAAHPGTMSLMPTEFAIGLCIAALVSVGAVVAGALTVPAAIASTVLGTIVFTAGGVAWSAPLITFFATSSLLSRFQSGDQRAPGQAREARRTARQVVANGLAPGGWAICQIVVAGNLWSLLFASAIATAAADTWATEIGRTSTQSPRDILTGRQVPRGMSGGITPRGLAAALAGSAVVAVACLLTGIIGRSDAMAVSVAGFGGALIDSVLGAALQERDWCPTCEEETEDAVHARCSTPTHCVRGVKGFDNDWVNLSATLSGSLLGAVVVHLT